MKNTLSAFAFGYSEYYSAIGSECAQAGTFGGSVGLALQSEGMSSVEVERVRGKATLAAKCAIMYTLFMRVAIFEN